jgi:hypothetical protein
MRAKTDYYFFCDGRLFAPEEIENLGAYKAAADKQLKRLLDTTGVGELVHQLR